MDDLLGEDWQQAPRKSTNTAPLNPSAFASNYSSFRASPQPPRSGIASPQPLSRPTSTVNASARPASDAFGNILALKSQKSASGNVSMQERQRQLQEEKRKQAQHHSQLWESLGSGRATPEIRGPSPAAPTVQEDEDDILAAFHKDAPVDRASHHPPPESAGVSGRNTPATGLGGQGLGVAEGGFDEDDDPFGLGSAPKRSNGHAVAPATQQVGDDDDILGDLGRPVTERPAQKAPSRAAEQAEAVFEQMQASAANGKAQDEPEDHALAELVDMGFPADTARIALAENGGDVQGAVGWLLQQAHEESKQKARSEAQTRRRSPVAGSRSPSRRQRSEQDGSVPAWMRQEGRAGSPSRRQDTGSPANGEKDPAQMAQDLGNKLFKGANSLWKASQKQMAKTMAEFQQERDPSQPRWMQQEATPETGRASSQRRQSERAAPHAQRPAAANATDEAAMLDMPREERPKSTRPSAPEQPIDSPARGRSPIESLPNRPSPQPRFMQQQPPPSQDKRPSTKLSRLDVEEQSAQAYVSPARRKRPTPKPEPQPEPEVDLFSPAQMSKPSPAPSPAPSVPSARTAQAQPTSRPIPAPVPIRPKAPPRNIPSVSPSALSISAQHRKKGGEAFKRGDFGAAHDAYTAALLPLPATHPLAIIVLCNRSLTALKTGDAKTAVSDADRALDTIGVGRGEGETIDLGASEGTKQMKEFYGKALMRKAEALEHIEKWSDAASVWRQAIEVGVGGAVSLRSRDRCEKAANPSKPAAAPVKNAAHTAPPRSKPPPPAKGLGNSLTRPALTTVASADAVKALRAANAAAEKADDEKFALTDQVDAKLTAWRGGKVDNLRALLQSLDGVLWEGAGWKKVGMSDLVMPNKVKIVYMKAIGKVHPDKIPLDATTEQRMISAAVFSTLNEAWDKFKRDNNL